MTITHVTRGKRRLALVKNTPRDKQWIYQLAFPFQVSPTEAALSVNIRLGKSRIVDIEVGGDLILFDDFEKIDDSRRVEVYRGSEMDHPRTGERVFMAALPGIPGFVPLGAKRADGSPHPHAGTGFALVFSRGYPVALADSEDTHVDLGSDVYGRVCMMQLRYDGTTMHITDVVEVDDNEFIQGTDSLFMSINGAIPSGDDLISGFCTGTFGDWHSGFARWRRGDDGKWKLNHYETLMPHTLEPSLVRDIDGSLLMLFRPWPRTNQEASTLHMMRSTDEGQTWERTCKAEPFWQMCPMSIATALDGSPYIMANRFREPRVNRYATREMIWAWPLSEDRQSLCEPTIVRDASTGFGPPTNGTVWRVDHPIGHTLRLADGNWRHILTYRGLEDAEMRTDAGATPMTGTYVEQMFSDGPVRPTWQF